MNTAKPTIPHSDIAGNKGDHAAVAVRDSMGIFNKYRMHSVPIQAITNVTGRGID
tara:strand:+ start:743 stop:907 length:165 start_codon:yes stop_codon:yes gene_type:complete